MARGKTRRQPAQNAPRTTGSMTHLLAWPVRLSAVDPTRKPTKITEPLCEIPGPWPAKSFRFTTFSGDAQTPPNAAEWNKCLLAARCIVVETLKAIQFTNGTQDDMSLFELPQVVGLLTDKMLGYMAALVFRVRSAMDGYKMLDRMIVYQRAYEHLILICKTNTEARVQIVGEFYQPEVVQIWTRNFADMLECCPPSCVSFLCDFVLRNEQGALRDFSAVCLSALLQKHTHWYANDIITRQFTSCYERHELTREDLEKMSARLGELARNPPPTPEPESESSSPQESADQSPEQEEPEGPEDAPEVHAPHVDTVLALCSSRGCPCVRKCVNGEDAGSEEAKFIAALRSGSSDTEKRAAVEQKIREALANPVAKLLPFDVVSAVFPVSFLDKAVWESIKTVAVLGQAAAFEQKESECLIVEGKCANWQTLSKALGM